MSVLLGEWGAEDIVGGEFKSSLTDPDEVLVYTVYTLCVYRSLGVVIRANILCTYI